MNFSFGAIMYSLGTPKSKEQINWLKFNRNRRNRSIGSNLNSLIPNALQYVDETPFVFQTSAIWPNQRNHSFKYIRPYTTSGIHRYIYLNIRICAEWSVTLVFQAGVLHIYIFCKPFVRHRSLGIFGSKHSHFLQTICPSPFTWYIWF